MVSDGFSKSRELDRLKVPASEMVKAEASDPEILKDKVSPSSSEAAMVVKDVVFSSAEIWAWTPGV